MTDNFRSFSLQGVDNLPWNKTPILTQLKKEKFKLTHNVFEN